MIRAARRWFTCLLASALVLLAPGSQAYAQVARVVESAGVSASPRALPAGAPLAPIAPTAVPLASFGPGLSAAPALSAHALATPAASAAAAPSAGVSAAAPMAPAAAAAAPAAAISAAAPQTEVAAAPASAPAAPSLGSTRSPAAAARADRGTAAARTPSAAAQVKDGVSFDGAAATPALLAVPSPAGLGAAPALAPARPGPALAAPASLAAPAADGSAPASASASAAGAAAAPAAPQTRLSRVRASVSDFLTNARGLVFGDRDLAWILKPINRTMTATRVYLALDGVLGIAMAYLTGPLLDTAKLAAAHGLAAYGPHLALISGAMLGVFALYTYVERQHVYLSRVAGLQAAREYRVALQTSFVAQEMDFHLKQGSGSLSGRLLNDTNYLSLRNVSSRLGLVINAVYLAVGVPLMLLTSPSIGALVLIAAPILGWINARYGEKFVKLSFTSSNLKASLMSSSQESLQHAETVKIFGSAGQEMARYRRDLDETVKNGEQSARLMANYMMISAGVSDFFTKNLVYILGGAAMALALGMSFGQLSQLASFAFLVKLGFSGLASEYLQYKSNEGSTKVVREFLLRRPAIADPAGAAVLPEGPGRVGFEDVTFAYPERKAEPVLKGLSFAAEPGQTVAFVGETGSGKSTITRLLLRLWEQDSGRVTVDGRDVREVTRASLLSRIAVVPQETRLFSGTLRENMLFGREDATPEQLDAAIRRAAADFVYDARRFPKGLDTPVAEGGSSLSGGERQRVAIVRAFLRDPQILILDEATSALDNRSERAVQAALDALASGAGGRKPTTIVVAHRLSTIRNADVINVLEKGSIVESGTHAELLALGGRYARLWRQGGYDAAPASLTTAATTESAATPSSPNAAAAPETSGPPSETAAAARPGLSARAKALLAGGKEKLRGFAEAVTDLVRGDAEFRPFLKSRGLMLIGAAVLTAVQVGAGLAGSALLGHFLDLVSAAAHPAAAALWRLSGWIALTSAVVIFAQRQSSWLLGVLQARSLADLRQALMARLHARPMSFHLKNESGTLASRVSEDAEALVKKNVDVRVPLLGAVLSLAFSSLFLFSVSATAGLIVLAMVPLLGVISGVYGQKSESLYEDFSRRRAALGRQAQETLEQIQTIKVTAREDAAVSRYRQKAQALVDTGEKGARINATAHMFSSALTDLFTRHLIYIGGAWLVGAALGLSLGQIAAMSFYTVFMKTAIDDLTTKWMDFKQSRGETDVIRGWLRETPDVDPPGALPLPEGPGAVVFENVGFKYSPDQDGAIVDGVSLRVEPGKTVAIVGASGSGKSTLLKLLEGLWKPASGRVLVDGADVAGAAKQSLAQAIAQVPQEARLFNATIRENMTYGSPQATEAELREAIRAARAEYVDDPKQFPLGLETRVGEGGAQLSGGQRQRVAIVRALLKKPRILLLDEATSALDKQTEREIQETLDRLTNATGRKPTTIVVAHNLTTIMGADEIVVMDAGRVVERGTHAELLGRGGVYARLWQASQGR